MFLDSAYASKGSSLFGHRRGNDSVGSGCSKATSRQAALDFVLELAGPRTVGPCGEKPLCQDSFFCGDELPIPTFAVDRDLRPTLWNRRACDLSGWTEAEVMKMKGFPGALLRPCSSSPLARSCSELLKGAIDGRDVSDMEFELRSKSSQRVRVQLNVGHRTDAAGAVSGAVCVLMPVPRPHTVAEKQEFDDGQEVASDSGDSEISSSTQVHNLAPEVEGLTFESRGPGRPGSSPSMGSSRFSFASLQSLDSGVHDSGEVVDNMRALVVDTISSNRKVLTALLERCGFGIACASSSQEATWRFGQGILERRGFDVVFMELVMASAEKYETVRELRRLERESQVHPQHRTLVVAVTSTNRWDLAGMDNCMDRGLEAGIDAFIQPALKMQHLKETLRKLGLRSNLLELPAKLPRALSGDLHNPLNITR